MAWNVKNKTSKKGWLKKIQKKRLKNEKKIISFISGIV